MPDVLLTDRLRIREWRGTAADVDALHAVLSDGATMRLWPAPFDRAGCEAWIAQARDCYAANGYGRWAVERRDTGAVIGDCGLNPTVLGGWSFIDIGWILHAGQHGEGLATEAARAIAAHAFGPLALDELIAHMAEDHAASRAVAERLGMTLSHRQPYARDRNKVHRFYRLTADMWGGA